MKIISEKHPIIFEIALFVISLLLAAVVAGILNASGCDNEVGSSIARILVGIVLLAVFYKNFHTGNSFKGFIPMLPLLLLAIYKIPYHFISGGGQPNAITIPILLAGLAPAVFEEILFRGIFITNLKKKYSSPTAVVLISAVVFSLVHLTNLVGMNVLSVLLQLIMALVTGIVFGAIYLYSGDLVSVIIAHFAIDVVGGIFPGGVTTPYYFLVILILLWIFEIVYGFLLVRKTAGGKTAGEKAAGE